MSKKSPQLRFEGFTYNWEERRLSEVLRERNNQQPQSMEYPLVSFTVENGVTPKTDRYEREQLVVGDKSSKKYKVTVLNDIVYNPANLKFGAISRNKYGNAVFSPIYVTFSVNNDVTMPEFIEMLITRKDFIKRALKYQQGTVYERQSVSPENLLSMNLYLPGKLEQEKIGTFFKHLDDTISLQQRKLDLLKEQKKGYLQKMFPKNGEKVPELRFAGFADDWEQRKLGEVSERVRGNDGRMDLPTLTISAGKGWLDQRERFSGNIAGKEQKNYTLLSKNELSYNKGNSKLAKYGVVYKLGTYKEALVPRVYHSFRTTRETDPDFIEYMFATKLPDRELGKLVTSGARMDGLLNINYDDFMGIKINIPYLQEQQKIGTFFKQLDDTIALHQRKLDLLKEQKKGFLQKMFV
ncbi:restriction endonuclease subunit S [Enterococcus thailandicus]|uniref:restriction endonuclease subunit S n=1 Tax=Enterococcus thailandicus TaxID=417368 RepID=UPI00244D92D2|nr:restriction endonuclease subunit S [Enterococcus thailandicus]GMC02414.1 restriction endonuclease [Enterococcus thailandicus]